MFLILYIHFRIISFYLDDLITEIFVYILQKYISEKQVLGNPKCGFNKKCKMFYDVKVKNNLFILNRRRKTYFSMTKTRFPVGVIGVKYVGKSV